MIPVIKLSYNEKQNKNTTQFQNAIENSQKMAVWK
jgi:hypothetical protein